MCRETENAGNGFFKNFFLNKLNFTSFIKKVPLFFQIFVKVLQKSVKINEVKNHSNKRISGRHLKTRMMCLFF